MAQERIDIIVRTDGITVTKRELADIGRISVDSSRGVNILQAALRGLGAGLSLKGVFDELNKLSELKNRISSITEEGQSVSSVFNKLATTANTVRAPIADVTRLFQRVAFSVRDMGRSQDDAIRITELLSKSFQLSGATSTEAAQSARQFAQALSRRELRGDELNSLLEEAPGLAKAFAEGLRLSEQEIKNLGDSTKSTKQFFDLYGRQMDVASISTNKLKTVLDSTGRVMQVVERNTQNLTEKQKLGNDLLEKLRANQGVSVADLKRLSEAGILTAERLLQALERQGSKIDNQFKRLPSTLSQAIAVVRNNIDILFFKFDEITGATGKVSDAIIAFANNTKLLEASIVAVAAVAIPLLLGALAKLTAALLGSGLGVFVLALGAVAGYLTLYRNEIGIAADGSLTFSKAVFSLNDGLNMLFNTFSRAKPGELGKAFAIPFPNIKASFDKIKQEYQKTANEATNLQRSSSADVGIQRANEVVVESLATRALGALSKIPLINKIPGVGLLGRLSGPASAGIAGAELVNETSKLADAYKDLTTQQMRAEDLEEKRLSTMKREGDVREKMQQIENEQYRVLSKRWTEEGMSFSKQIELRAKLQQQDREQDPTRERLRRLAENELAADKQQLKIQQDITQAMQQQARIGQSATGPRATDQFNPITKNQSLQELQALQQTSDQVFNQLKEKTKEVGASIADNLIPKQLSENLSNAISPLTNKIGSAFEEATQKAQATMTVAETLDNIITNIRASVASTVGFVIGGLSQAIVEMESFVIRILEAIKEVFSFLSATIDAILAKLGSVGGAAQRIMDAAKAGAAAGAQGVRDNPTTLFQNNAQFEAFSNALGVIRDRLGGVNEEAAKLPPTLDQGSQSANQLGQGLNNLGNQGGQALQNLGNKANEMQQQLGQLVQSLASNLENAVVDFVTKGKFDFKSLINSWIADITRFAFRTLILKPLLGMFGLGGGGGGGGGLLGGLFGGGFARGGLVPGFASGGLIGGPGSPTSDSLLARLSPGEFVMPAYNTAQNLPALDFMRKGGVIRGDMKSGGGVMFAPSITVNVQSNGQEDSSEQGRRVAKEVEATIQKQFTQMLRKETRPGGMLSRNRETM